MNEMQEMCRLPATQRNAGCLLSYYEFKSANLSAWQRGRTQVSGQTARSHAPVGHEDSSAQGVIARATLSVVSRERDREEPREGAEGVGRN